MTFDLCTKWSAFIQDRRPGGKVHFVRPTSEQRFHGMYERAKWEKTVRIANDNNSICSITCDGLSTESDLHLLNIHMFIGRSTSSNFFLHRCTYARCAHRMNLNATELCSSIEHIASIQIRIPRNITTTEEITSAKKLLCRILRSHSMCPFQYFYIWCRSTR